MEILKYWKKNRSIFSPFHSSIVPSFHRSIKGFSLLEMLIVIMIVGILFVAFRGSFQVKDKEVLYGQACIETVYGQLNNFLHAGLSSKSVNSGDTQMFPEQYIIDFKPSSGAMILRYEDEGSEYIYSSIAITGSTNMTYCSSSNYTIVMTGDTYELHINKGLTENTSLQFFYLSGGNISTGGNTFLQCNTVGTGCKTIARFESDTRTISLKKQICLSFTGDDCLEWDN